VASSFLDRTVGQSLEDFAALSPEQRAGAIRRAVPDLNWFFDEGRPFTDRQAPPRTKELAQSLYQALMPVERDAKAKTLDQRIVTDDLLRSEADRDQNVYLGPLFTRSLTRAVPDLIFQPVTAAECVAALRWARESRVPVTLRGAASTAMGGSVPNDGGLTLDLTRLDQVELDAAGRVCVIGAGARLRTIHERLAERGLALSSYPSNLGGTLVGWFVTGGVGMNAFGRGRALDSVKAADLLLPSGEHVRFHDDGRLDVPDGKHRKTLAAPEAAEWFRARGSAPWTLGDVAGSEGTFGLVLQVTVKVEQRPELGAFLLSFERRDQALEAAAWVATRASAPPLNVKFFSGSHMHHVRRVWEDEAAREWKRRPSELSSGATLPWISIAGPRELGARTQEDSDHAAAYLFVDFADLDAARAFAGALGECPGNPRALDKESTRFAAERFKPQQTKRLGPGLLAAEILMPAAEVPPFLPQAEALARAAGNTLDAEVYYLAEGEALVIAGYLTDHRSGAVLMDLALAPALLDLAMKRHRARPYVLGRWQSVYFRGKHGGDADRLLAIRRSLDPHELLSRGVRFRLRLHGLFGGLMAATMAPGVGLFRAALGAGVGSALRGILGGFPGPAKGRGEPAHVGAPFRASAPHEPRGSAAAGTPQQAAARALHCVNCGECNTVCPIFHDAGVRLPQMLTHLGEGVFAGEQVSRTGGTLLDLCMRCGNCEEVCQAGIPHLPIYEIMQQRADAERPHDRERHVAILAAVRASTRYTRDFLDLRPGGYVKRTPASLPGVNRYQLLRAENDSGPAATCIHCGGCVPVCPTGANRELEGADARWITTDQDRCIGCGTCVEVCPANLANGGQTLRVMEAPTAGWFVALEEFERSKS
jgi:FAD/FMN-containing dehydrogenase/ferredoxin